MISIKSQEFLKDLYKYLSKQENQGVYVINFFNAAGCKTFTLPRLKAQRTTQYLENERHYAKDRSVFQMRSDFPNPIDIDGLSKYLNDSLKDDSVRECMNHFGIAATHKENKRLLARALALQFQRFIEADSEDVNNEVPTEYEALVNGVDNSYELRNSVLYPGDNFWAEESHQKHEVNCFERFNHTWVIHNAGTVYWSGRKLVLKDANKNSPRPEAMEIPIPDVGPNGIIKIATNFEARSMEGKFIVEWDMKDSKDQSCFRMSAGLNVTVNVSYRIDTED